jgi:hypothetical protein
MHKTLIVTCIVIFATILSLSCGKTTSTKELTESSARALIEGFYANNYYPINVAPLVPLFAQTRIDYKTVDDKFGLGKDMRLFLERGLIEQHTETLSYPNISGIFTGEIHFAGAMRYEPENIIYNQYNLQMNADSNSFSGTLTISHQEGRSADGTIAPGPIEVTGVNKVTGTVQPDGSVSIEGGNLGANGKYTEQGTVASLTLPGPYYQGAEWHLVGKATGRTEMKWYTYSLTPEGYKQIEQTRNSMELRAGKFKIGEVTNLRLVTDTVAVANFAWEASLNDLGKTLFQYAQDELRSRNLPTNDVPKGVGEAQFAKKPDGSWIISSANAQ